MFEIRLDTTEAEKKLRAMARYLSKQTLAKISARALNRANRAAGVAFSKEIRKDLAVKSSTVKEALQLKKATPANLSAPIIASNKPLPMSEYRMNQTRRGVSIRVKKSGKRVKLKHAFIVEGYGNEAFERRGKARHPLRMLYGPSIGSQTKEAWPAVEARAVEILDKRMEHEITRAFERANRR